MSDIFLSYSSKNRQWAKLLAECLQLQGWSVWWDRAIPAGKTFARVISDAISEARCVVVIWSQDAIHSNWVQEEAEEGRDRGVLVPVFMENVKPAMGFRSIHAADLSNWDGNPESADFKRLIQDLVLVLGPPKPPVHEGEEPSVTLATEELPPPEVIAPGPPEPPAALTAPPPSKPEPAKRTTHKPATRKPKPADTAPPKAVTPQGTPVSEPFKPSSRGRIWLFGVPTVLALLLLVFFGARYLRPQKSPPPAPPSPSPSATLTNHIGIKFVLIPAGTFLMGSKMSPEEVAARYGGEAEKFTHEHPQHQVTISRAFYLQTTLVTQRQWKEVMGGNPSSFSGCGEDCPVEQVSWDDAQKFIKKLNAMEKTDKYRLPTEAEWEYACRAGSTSSFYFGDHKADLRKYAWYRGNSQNSPHPVGQLKPNAWGLFDMHGNLWEWCQDLYGAYPSGPVTDPKGQAAAGSRERVYRGGSWASGAWNLRSATRGGGLPNSSPSNDGGFRVAKDL